MKKLLLLSLIFFTGFEASSKKTLEINKEDLNSCAPFYYDYREEVDRKSQYDVIDVVVPHRTNWEITLSFEDLREGVITNDELTTGKPHMNTIDEAFPRFVAGLTTVQKKIMKLVCDQLDCPKIFPGENKIADAGDYSYRSIDYIRMELVNYKNYESNKDSFFYLVHFGFGNGNFGFLVAEVSKNNKIELVAAKEEATYCNSEFVK